MNIKKEKVFIFNIVTAYDNAGDVLINRALIDNIRPYGRVLVATSHLPENFEAQLRLRDEECASTFRKAILKNVFKSRVYKIGIPGHSFDQSPKFINGILELIYTAFFRYFLNVKFLRVGNSYINLHPYRRVIEKLKAYFYELYGVRDEASIDLFSSKYITYFPDLAFMSHDLIEKRGGVSKGYCFVSVRADFPDAKIQEGYLDKVIKKVFQFSDCLSLDAILIGYQVPEDKQSCKMLAESLRIMGVENIKFINEPLSFQMSVKLISEAEIVLSNRLHIVLPALVMGVRHGVVTDARKHTKIISLYKTIGAEFAIYDIDDDRDVVISNLNNTENLIEIADCQRGIALDKLEALL